MYFLDCTVHSVHSRPGHQDQAPETTDPVKSLKSPTTKASRVLSLWREN